MPLRIWILVAALLTACASSGGGEAGDELIFLDSQIFDARLHDSLDAGHPDVTVAFEGADVTANQLPERIDRWLYTIAQSDGTVALEPDPDLPAGRGLIGIAITMTIGAYKFVRETAFYWPARSYHATLYHVPDGSQLTRVVFTRR